MSRIYSDLIKAIDKDDFAYVEKHVNDNNIEDKDINRWTLLNRALFYGRDKIAKFLIMRSAIDEHGSLISKGANIEARDTDGWTPLHFTVFKNCLEIAELLLSKGGNIEAKDKDGMTPLHHATKQTKIEMVRLLLTHGADREARDDRNRRPIDLTKNEKIITLLEEWQDLLEVKEPADYE